MRGSGCATRQRKLLLDNYTRVIARLPSINARLDRDHTVHHVTLESGDAAPHDRLRTISVLVIDDDAEASDMADAVLSRAGYTVATAANGLEALALLRLVRPELILLDICMPVCDGAQFRQEQRRHMEWLKIPTIVMTGIADEPVLDVAIEEALRKPVRAGELLAIAGRYCTPPDRGHHR